MPVCVKTWNSKQWMRKNFLRKRMGMGMGSVIMREKIVIKLL
jgi:hypothetical protein